MSNIVVWRPQLDLGMIAAYRKVRAASDLRRVKHVRLHKQVDTIIGRLAEAHCDRELRIIEALQLELRLITKGTPVTEALTPDDKEPIMTSHPGFSQRQYDALTQVIKRVYRKLAMLCHPDRGGDIVVFQEVETAYGMRDINRLNAIYLSIVEGRNLYWQQSSGVYHVSTELQRYGVEEELLKQTAGWRATRLYLAGQVNSAADIVKIYLTDKAVSLLSEINYVVNKGKHHGKEGTRDQELEESGQEGGQGLERIQRQENEFERLRQEIQGRQEHEDGKVVQGYVSTGESAPGPR
jgi:hypothetical protein